MGVRLTNVVLVGVGFLFLFTANQTISFIEPIVIPSVNEDFKHAWNGREWNAYNALALNYIVFSLSGWISPSIVVLLGPKLALVLSAFALWSVNFVFIFPFYLGLMINSSISGLASAVLWTSQGCILALNSKVTTINRNSAIFWIFYQGSLISGNIFVMHEFEGHETIDSKTRVITLSMLTAIATLGVVALFFLRDIEVDSGSSSISPYKAFCNALKLIRTKKMFLLCITFTYLGIVVSFYSGIYNSSIGFTKSLGVDRKKYSGESAILLGFGEIAGALIFIALSIKYRSQGSCSQQIVFYSYLIQVCCFVALYFNLPTNASLRETGDEAIIHTSLILALAVSFFIGISDALIQTQVFTLIGTIYRDNALPAFAIFTFIQSFSSAVAFYYSNFANLHVHTYLLIAGSTLSTLALLKVYNITRPKSIKVIERVSIDKEKDVVKVGV